MSRLFDFPMDRVAGIRRQEAEEIRQQLRQGKTPEQIERAKASARLVENATVDPNDRLDQGPDIDWRKNSVFACGCKATQMTRNVAETVSGWTEDGKCVYCGERMGHCACWTNFLASKYGNKDDMLLPPEM